MTIAPFTRMWTNEHPFHRGCCVDGTTRTIRLSIAVGMPIGAATLALDDRLALCEHIQLYFVYRDVVVSNTSQNCQATRQIPC